TTGIVILHGNGDGIDPRPRVSMRCAARPVTGPSRGDNRIRRAIIPRERTLVSILAAHIRKVYVNSHSRGRAAVCDGVNWPGYASDERVHIVYCDLSVSGPNT